MGKLLDTYAWVQAAKDEEVDPALRDELREQLRQRLADSLASGAVAEIPDELVDYTLSGMAWVARMVAEEDVDYAELMEVMEALQAPTFERISAQVSAGRLPIEQAMQAVAGAFGFTMLWVGLRLRKEGDGLDG